MINTKKTFRTTFTESGFTLLELLVVLVIVGVMLGVVTFNGIPDDRQALQKDAQRIALLLQLARDEAIVRNSQVAFELGSENYRFYIKNLNTWELITDDEMFRERNFSRSPLAITLQPNPVPEQLPLRIIFGREPVNKPFTLTLSYADATVMIYSDGVGHFSIQQPD